MRDHAEPVARLLPQPDPHPVADVEPLGLDPLVVEHQAAVGQHPVDVGQHQLDLLAAFGPEFIGDSAWIRG